LAPGAQVSCAESIVDFFTDYFNDLKSVISDQQVSKLSAQANVFTSILSDASNLAGMA
jgi:hypothetical protein